MESDNSTATTDILVSGTNQVVGGINGSGTTQVNAGRDLTANHIVQSSLIIGGSAGSPATVTIDASDASGNPLGEENGLVLLGSIASSDPVSGRLGGYFGCWRRNWEQLPRARLARRSPAQRASGETAAVRTFDCCPRDVRFNRLWNRQGSMQTTSIRTNLYNEKTQVFGTTLGHNNETVADPRYLDLITRGLLWSVDKLDDAHLKPAKQSLLSE